ncbi:Hypothetical predicted protein [Podarcis lilfordi]|uniref:Uncharacterized protein n=1 Tax=Podarcis lilfordi TaxID=74358 RepID=A0AA35KKQ1_9SAUR|nr:Hypothetical predicted protein [Podarcis lilfordi]
MNGSFLPSSRQAASFLAASAANAPMASLGVETRLIPPPLPFSRHRAKTHPQLRPRLSPRNLGGALKSSVTAHQRTEPEGKALPSRSSAASPALACALRRLHTAAPGHRRVGRARAPRRALLAD